MIVDYWVLSFAIVETVLYGRIKEEMTCGGLLQPLLVRCRTRGAEATGQGIAPPPSRALYGWNARLGAGFIWLALASVVGCAPLDWGRVCGETVKKA